MTPSCNAGVVSYSTNGSLPTFVTITQLTSLVDQILTAGRGRAAARAPRSAASSTGIIDYDPDGNLLTCDTSAPGTTASAKVGVLNLGLLSGLRAASASNVGDVSVDRQRDRGHARRGHVARGGHRPPRPSRRRRRRRAQRDHGAHRRVLGRHVARSS